ncbi:MAG: hypothetical protein KJS92_05895 [Bacteroidetes bacterium]|nr:hypothetical protein [Bacteroidota bacterium]
MKLHKILPVAALLFVTGNLAAQDTLILVNKEVVLCKVKTINRSDVDYVLWTSKSGPIYGVSKSMIHKIQYETGGEVILNPLPKEEKRSTGRDSAMQGTYMQGVEDARKNYFGYGPARTASVGMGFLALFTSGLSAIPSALMSVKEPDKERLGLPDEALFDNNKSYRDGYLYEAKKIKSKKIWGGFGAGVGLFVVSIVGLVILF